MTTKWTNPLYFGTCNCCNVLLLDEQRQYLAFNLWWICILRIERKCRHFFFKEEIGSSGCREGIGRIDPSFCVAYCSSSCCCLVESFCRVVGCGQIACLPKMNHSISEFRLLFCISIHLLPNAARACFSRDTQLSRNKLFACQGKRSSIKEKRGNYSNPSRRCFLVYSKTI